MKISKAIETLNKYKNLYGDLECVSEFQNGDFYKIKISASDLFKSEAEDDSVYSYFNKNNGKTKRVIKVTI